MAGVESAVSFLVSRLGDMLAQEVSLLSGVRGQVEWLETELLRMRSFLIDADRSSSIGDSERLKNWKRELRDLVDSAEEAIDTFIAIVKPLSRGERDSCLGQLKRYVFIHQELAARHKVASEIADIKLKLSSLAESRAIYGIEFKGQEADAAGSGGRRIFQEHMLSSPSIPAETDFVGCRRIFQEHMLSSPSIPIETDFVGFANELTKVITWLTSEEPRRLCIFPVVGMGGLGKTTFATKVYNDSSVKEHFEERAWVSISQQFAVTDIYTALLRCVKKLSEQELQNYARDMQQLRESIFRHLKEKKYLIVLDDVWTKEALDALKEAFPDSENGSRVLLTSRNLDVASHADPQIRLLQLRLLTRDESWELFCKKTFSGQKNCWPLDFEKVGRQIVENCHGLPLAVVAVGGMLAGKNKTEWEHLLKSISWRFGDQGEVIISGLLKLSYEDLPCDLKPCFLYLEIFPEDREFRAKRLIHMWAAEGLLQQRGDKTVEEVGEDCLRALVRRNMIQVAETSSTGGIKSCRIHDLLHDIAVSEAKGDEFLHVQRASTNIPLSSSVKSRRLAIHCDEASINECISSKSAVSHLRSMIIHSQGLMGFEQKRQKSLYSRCKLLRVLYLHEVRINKLPSEIGDLIHLRYFGCVGGTELRSLPSSIGNLRSLQTLIIDSIESITIPCAIQKMQELRHLQVTHTHFAMVGFCGGFFDGQPRLEQVSNLQTLTHVKAGKWLCNSLGKFQSSLRKLGINLDSGAYYRSITRLESLQSLSLASPQCGEEIPNLVPLTHIPQLRKLALWGKLEKLPERSEFPPNLTKLTLSHSRLVQDPMATLEKLQNLRTLRLLKFSYMGKEMNCSAEGFPSLEYLSLEGLPNLYKWIIEIGAMRRLAHLIISFCEKLKMLPEGVKHLRALKKLEAWRMPPEFYARLRADAEADWHLIRHIPSIDIR